MTQAPFISTFGNGLTEYQLQCLQMFEGIRNGTTKLHVATSPTSGGSKGVTVGKVGSFGFGETDAWAQIWQILSDAISGAAPLTINNV